MMNTSYKSDDSSGANESSNNNSTSSSTKVLLTSDMISSSSAEDQIENGRRNWNRMEIAHSSNNQEFASNSRPLQLATTASWVVNWTLLIIKTYVFAVSGSKAVLAAMVDSAVDLASQAVLSLSDMYINKHSPDYPVGRSRLEALSVLASAFIMTMASIEVIQFSIVDIAGGINGNIPAIDISVASYTILALVVVFKLVLYLYCKWANALMSLKSDSMEALAEDHLNDVFSNVGAIISASIAHNIRSAWWVDPLGAIILSLIIIGRWVNIMFEQVKKIVGHTAPPEFIEQVEKLAISHDPRLNVDCIRAYHFGARYNVEMEIVLPGTMTVMESHDIALALQHQIESLDDVERAFVHVDHQLRDGLEHKIERQLVKGPDAPLISGSPEDVESHPVETLRSRNIYSKQSNNTKSDVSTASL